MRKEVQEYIDCITWNIQKEFGYSSHSDIDKVKGWLKALYEHGYKHGADDLHDRLTNPV